MRGRASGDRSLNILIARTKCLIRLQTLSIGSIGRRSTFEEQPQPDGNEDDGYNSYHDAIRDVVAMVLREIKTQSAVDDGEKNKQRTQEEMDLADDGWLFRSAVDEVVDDSKTELDEDRSEDDETENLMCGVEIPRLLYHISSNSPKICQGCVFFDSPDYNDATNARLIQNRPAQVAHRLPAQHHAREHFVVSSTAAHPKER